MCLIAKEINKERNNDEWWDGNENTKPRKFLQELGTNIIRNSDVDYDKGCFACLFGGTYMKDITNVICWGAKLANIDVSTINYVGGAFKRWGSNDNWYYKIPKFMTYNANPYK